MKLVNNNKATGSTYSTLTIHMHGLGEMEQLVVWKWMLNQ
jgi:hypothetical protein